MASLTPGSGLGPAGMVANTTPAMQQGAAAGQQAWAEQQGLATEQLYSQLSVSQFADAQSMQEMWAGTILQGQKQAESFANSVTNTAATTAKNELANVAAAG